MTNNNQLFYTRENLGFWQLDLQKKDAKPVQLMNKAEFDVTYSWGISNNNLYYHHLNGQYSLLKHFDLQLLGTKTVAKLPLMTFSDNQFSLSVAAESKVLFTNAQHPQADIKQLINLSIL